MGYGSPKRQRRARGAQGKPDGASSLDQVGSPRLAGCGRSCQAAPAARLLTRRPAPGQPVRGRPALGYLLSLGALSIPPGTPLGVIGGRTAGTGGSSERLSDGHPFRGAFTFHDEIGVGQVAALGDDQTEVED